MIFYLVHSLVTALDLIEQEVGICIRRAQEGSPLTDDDKNRIQNNFRFIVQKLTEIELEGSIELAERLANDVRIGAAAPLVFWPQLQSLRRLIVDQIQLRRFIYIQQDKARLIIGISAHWQAVWDKFPSVRVDSESAVECYALGQNTASVFHSMLVLETGLLSLSASIGITKPSKNWGGVIGQIETEIAKRRQLAQALPKGSKPPSPKTAKRHADLIAFYSSAAKEFVYFKDAWRNHVAHGRAHYDQFEAARVLVHVREFMAHLCTRLKERK